MAHGWRSCTCDVSAMSHILHRNESCHTYIIWMSVVFVCVTWCGIIFVIRSVVGSVIQFVRRGHMCGAVWLVICQSCCTCTDIMRILVRIPLVRMPHFICGSYATLYMSVMLHMHRYNVNCTNGIWDVYTYIYTYTCTYIHIHIYTYTYTYRYNVNCTNGIWASLATHTTYECVRHFWVWRLERLFCINIYMSMYIYVNVYIYICIYVCKYTYIYTHTTHSILQTLCWLKDNKYSTRLS